MSKHRAILWLNIVVLGLVLLACEGGSITQFLAFSNPTATLTRTPRPTFTIKPEFTPTLAEAAQATDTPTLVGPIPTEIVALASATATRRPPATTAPRSPTPKPPPPPTAVPYLFSMDANYACPQPNDPIFKVTGRIQRNSDKAWLDGYYLGIFNSGGKFLGASGPSTADFTETLNGNCRAYNRYRSNAEVDVSPYRGDIPLTIRLMRSKTDYTPLAPDCVSCFKEAGNYYVEYMLR